MNLETQELLEKSLTNVRLTKEEKETFFGYTDYYTAPIGGGNPYYCCSSCGRPVPEINGYLLTHTNDCDFREREVKKLLEQFEPIETIYYTIILVENGNPQKVISIQKVEEKDAFETFLDVIFKTTQDKVLFEDDFLKEGFKNKYIELKDHIIFLHTK